MFLPRVLQGKILYTTYRSRGGWKLDGVDKGSSNQPPPQFDTFCTGFGIPGVPRGFKPLSLYTFYVRVGQPFRGHPQDSSVFHEPPGLYILRACVYFWIFIGQLEFIAPLVLYFSGFLDTQVAELKKRTCLISGRRSSQSLFWPHPSLVEPKEPNSIKNTGFKTYKTRTHRKNKLGKHKIIKICQTPDFD